jgi:hypothetical protein
MFELMYKANELGFQPEADYLPVQVEDTADVSDAKAKFRAAFDEFKAMVKKIAVEYRESLSKEEPEEVAIDEEENSLDNVEVINRSKRQILQYGNPYYFQPSLVYQPRPVFVQSTPILTQRYSFGIRPYTILH